MSSNSKNPYRTTLCRDLANAPHPQKVRVAGWLHGKRDLGQLLFLILRDSSCSIQCLVEEGHPHFETLASLNLESVLSLEGILQKRPQDTSQDTPLGHLEIRIIDINVLSVAEPLPFSVNKDMDLSDELRQSYRFLDLRRPHIHQLILLRSAIIHFLRQTLHRHGFTEFQTPLLTSSSPEGARDYLIPSRHFPGRFYALPQSPQQFKQLLMTAGFDRYFQISPCFRDEDARADRSPGEFYQLDLEMAFVTQEEVWNFSEKILMELFEAFAPGLIKTQAPFMRLPYKEALARYGTDKPDLRNPLILHDLKDIFNTTTFQPFKDCLGREGSIRGILITSRELTRKFWDELNLEVKALGGGPLGLVTLNHEMTSLQGPLIKYMDSSSQKKMLALGAHKDPEANIMVVIAGKNQQVNKVGHHVRQHLGTALGLSATSGYYFCWITDFPFFERTPEGLWDFAHNPFSMPQGGLEALKNHDPETLTAYQYDMVCNGIELASGAIRNYRPDIMYAAFAQCGYSVQDVETRFGGLLKAFHYGAPPHGGIAPGIERLVMLLGKTDFLRDVVAFPLTQQAQDLLMGAPSPVDPALLKELGLSLIRNH